MMSEENPLPPRREIFADAVARAVWAAIVALDTALQHEILRELQRLLCVPARLDTHGTRVAHAVTCLRQVAEIVGKSPSVTEYRRVRAARRELGLPDDAVVRRWLGGTWNDCLAQARLDRVPDGDALVYELGPAITAEEVTAALKDCAKDLKTIPTYHRYLNWARRPDVRGRPGRRPLSHSPFERTYGGFVDALKAAGLIDGEAVQPLDRSTLIRVGSYFVSNETIRAALLRVSERLGHSPRVHEYNLERERMISEAQASGDVPALPSHNLIQGRYGTWDAALIDAGIEPLGGRETGRYAGPRPWLKARKVSDEVILEAVREAYEAVGHPFTSTAYRRWRKEQKQRDLAARRVRRLPDYHTIWKRYGTWENALAHALGGVADCDRPTGESES